MSGKKKHVLVDSKEHTNPGKVATFLRELADRVEGGEVVLRQGQDEVTARLPDQLILEVSLDEKQKGAKGIKKSLEVEVEWYEGEGTRGPVSLG